MDGKPMFRCVNRSALRLQASWEECLPLARAAGFEGFDVEIEPGDSASKHSEALAGHGLRPGGAKMPFDFREDVAATKEGIASLEKVARIASEVGSTRFYTFLYAYSDTLPWKENFQWHVGR